MAEEAEAEAGVGLRFAVWDGAPKWNEPEALIGGAETFSCCQAIAAQGSFDAKHELQSFINVKYEKVAESVRDVQRKFREDRAHEHGERNADENEPFVDEQENTENTPMAVDNAAGVPGEAEENSQMP